MIDASTFAASYNAFWNVNTPMCEDFVRRINLGLVDRVWPPLAASNTTKQRAVIAEYAFSLFVERERGLMADCQLPSRAGVEAAAWEATEQHLRPYVGQGLELQREFDSEAKEEISSIAARLNQFFRGAAPCVFRPLLRGCGFIDASEADIIHGPVLFEIKTVDRTFRSTDVRQTITYAALNYAARQYEIDSVGLVNPRRGQVYQCSLDEACWEISGRPAEKLLSLVIQAIAGGDISR